MQRTTKRHLRGAVMAAVTASIMVAGCGGDDSGEPAGLDADTSTADAPDDTSASPDPTGDDSAAEGGPITHEFADAGVTVVAPAASSQAEGAALATYAEFAHQWRKSLRDVQLSETLPDLAATPIIADVESSLEYQEKNGIRYGGEIVFTPTVEQSNDRLVILGGCADASKLTLIDDGEETVPDGLAEHPVVPMQVVVANNGAGWMVNENTLHEEKSC